MWAGDAWVCAMCRRRSAKWADIAPKRCEGSAAIQWAKRAAAVAGSGGRDGGGHRRMMSADVIWCDRCGAYATDKSKGLAQLCPGVPGDWSGGGRPQQLAALRAGKHPKTGEWLGCPCPEPRWDALATDAGNAAALPRIAAGFLEQRRPCHDRAACEVPRPPAPQPAAVACPAARSGFSVQCTASGAERRDAMYARVRAKGAQATATAAAGGSLAVALCAAVTVAPAGGPAAAGRAGAAADVEGCHGGAQAGLGPVAVCLPNEAGPAQEPGLVRRRCRVKGCPRAWQ